MADLYKILGVDRSASPEQLKRAFRKMSKKLHPDVGGNAEAFQEIEKAYRVLSDPQERAYYDHHGAARVKEPEKNPNTELYKMLTEVLMVVAMEMQSPATQDLVKLMRKRMADSIVELEKKIVETAKVALKLETVIARIQSRTPENVLAALMRSQFDGFEAQVARGKLMIETLKKGMLFLDDYAYEMTKMIASADLAEALRRQDSGAYDHFFTFKT